MADFYTMEEAARVLGISLDELKQRIANGELRHAGEGGSPQFRKTEVDEYARRQGYELYYPGYTLENPSPMDYKKRLHGLEFYEWNQAWLPYERQTSFGRQHSIAAPWSKPAPESTLSVKLEPAPATA